MAGLSFYMFCRTVLLAAWVAVSVLMPVSQRPPSDKNGHYPGFVGYADSLVAAPDTPEKFQLLAEYWLQQLDLEQYDRYLGEGLAMFPGDAGLLHMRAESLTREARFDEAAAIYEHLLACDDDPQTLLDLAHTEKLAGRQDEAGQLYDRAYRAAPDADGVFDAYYRFLDAYLSPKKADGLAIRHTRTGNPTAEQWGLAGDAWIERNRPYRAIDAYEHAGPDSNLTAAIVILRLKQYLRPGLYSRYEYIEDEVQNSTTRYDRLYTSFDYRPSDWWTFTVEHLYDHVRRSYIDETDLPEQEREVHLLTGSVYFLPFSSLFVGGKAQYLASQGKWAGWSATCEQDLPMENWTFWWRLIHSVDTVEYWDFTQQTEDVAQIQIDWRDWTLFASWSRFLTKDDEVFVAPEFSWMYDKIEEKDNEGYQGRVTLEHAVLDEPELSLGAYALGNGYDYESRFYASPGEQLYYGLMASLGAPVSILQAHVDGQLGMDEDYETNWVINVEADYEMRWFTITFGVSFDDDGYSRSHRFSFAISELSL